MNIIPLFLLSLFFNSIFINADVLQCGKEKISNCKECGQGENSNRCETCEAKHFPVLENLFCLACNDPVNGQVGCIGGCTISDNSDYGNTYCQECKEGYYNLHGKCIKCQDSNPGCSICYYDENTEQGYNPVKCQKCLNEEEYRLDEDFNCVKCQNEIYGCKKCHYTGDVDFPVECDECEENLYLNSNKECDYGQDIEIEGGECYICSDDPDDEPSFCYCYSGYILVGNSCKQCPDNCDQCIYNEESDSTKCLSCQAGYIFDSMNECIPCDEGCNYCDLDENNNPICLVCQEEFIPHEKKCYTSPDNCEEIGYDSTQREIICTSCKTGYVLDPEDNQCKSCNEVDGTMEGCASFIYNSLNEKCECNMCIIGLDYNYDYVHNYAFVNNMLQCLGNTNPDVIGLYGCETAQYIQSSEKYECLKCKRYDNDFFIPVITDKSCIEPPSVELSSQCLEAEKIGDTYSCTKCSDKYALVEDTTTHIKNCYRRQDELSYCLEGKKDNDNFICDKCVSNSEKSENICSCNSDSFSVDTNLCYKCNDIKYGIPGCDISKGCYFDSSTYQITCRACKEGYFESIEGQCLLCSGQVANCGKCHYNNANEKVICDECTNSIYFLNTEENKCELNDCQEYPELSPGCIICKDKLNEYKESNKCQLCKYGYFKTKEEKCVYCSSEENGGPGCYKCGYETNEIGIETNKIICKECYTQDYYKYSNDEGDYSYYFLDENYLNPPLLSKEGKCYNCKIQFSEACNECDFKTNVDGTESLQCISCYPGYYFTPEGNCIKINYLNNLIPRIPNCIQYSLTLGENQCIISVNEDESYFNITHYTDKNTIYKEIYSTGLKLYEKDCLECKQGFFLNDKGECEKINYDKCSFNLILNNYYKFYQICSNFCQNSNNQNVIIILTKTLPDGYDSEFSINDFDYNNYNIFIDYFKNSDKIKVCLNNSGEGGEFSPDNLKGCEEAYYFPENNTYICKSSFNEYTKNDETNLCTKINKDSCTIENFGTESMPKYRCVDNLNYMIETFTLVKNENGKKEFLKEKGDLKGCLEADANTKYINSKYNCTKCTSRYIPFYSKYYKRNICQDIKGKIIKEKNISYDSFYEVKEKVKTENKICPKSYFFTPDEEYCYRCDDETVGMPGCKGGCSFSLKRNNQLKCEGGCKTGYIESSEGICSLCNSINKGCYECHYDDEYPIEYQGIKRKRRFICDFCEEGYTQSLTGECSDCKDLGLKKCSKCSVDQKNKKNYVCTKCEEGYFIDEAGHCQFCDTTHFKAISGNKCIQCNNTLEGGIDNCPFCENNGERAICKQCYPGYILLTNNNSCLEIIKNKDLENFVNCEELTLENNKLLCSKCKIPYSLVKTNDIKKCIYTRTLYEPYFTTYDGVHYIIKKGKAFYDDYEYYTKNDYIFQIYSLLYPCQEAENKGTEENPLYSCLKCYEEFEHKDEYATKITEVNSNLSFCLLFNELKELKNCTEATYEIINGKEIYNCTNCIKNNILTYNKNTGTNFCQFTYDKTKCSVLYCKICNPNDGYTCDECFPDYEVNILTGSCVKKTVVVPSVTWKDIYKLKMNAEKVINNKNIYGPSFLIRGITSSQINSRHTFMIYLIFSIRHNIRNLEGEETIKIPGLCEIINEVEGTNEDVNIVEYFCIGNQSSNIDLTNYELEKIEEGNNENILKKSNLNELVIEIKEKLGDLSKLENIIESNFTYEDLIKIVIFQMNENITNIKANDFKFNFIIKGKLSKNITSKELNIEKEFELYEIETKANCTFNISLNQTADLSCDLNVENYKNITTFSFKTSQINTDDNEIYFSKLNDIILINSEEKVEEEEKEDDDDGNKKVIIIVSVICGVVGATLIGVGIFFLVKKLKSNKSQIVEEENNKEIIDKNTLQSNDIKIYKEHSENNIVKSDIK